MWLRPVLDLLALTLAVLVVGAWSSTAGLHAGGWTFAVFPPAVMVLLAARGMYARRLRVSILDGVPPVVSAISLGAIVLVAAEVYVLDEELSTAVLLYLWTVSLATVGCVRIGSAGAQRSARLPILGSHEDVEWIASLSGAQHIVLAFSQLRDRELVTFAQRCTDLGLEVSVVPRLFEAAAHPGRGLPHRGVGARVRRGPALLASHA